MARGIAISVKVNRRGVRTLERNLALLPAQFAKVAQQAANSISLEAKRLVERQIPVHFDQPEAATRDAIYARVGRLGNAKSLKDITSGIGIRQQQSEWLRFHVGEENQTRMPGQIGPANKHVFIPIRKNIMSTQANARGIRVRLTGGNNMPVGTLRGLFDKTGPGKVLFFTRLRGTGRLGLFLRPTKTKGKNDYSPKLIVAAIPRARYEPSFQPVIDGAVRKAVRRFPQKVREGARRHVRMQR